MSEHNCDDTHRINGHCRVCGDVEKPPGVQMAILIAGQLAGIAHQLDADALERWLNTKPKDFNYEPWCRAGIAFKRAIALPPND